jgi:hypothetical protein
MVRARSRRRGRTDLRTIQSRAQIAASQPARPKAPTAATRAAGSTGAAGGWPGPERQSAVPAAIAGRITARARAGARA